MPVLVEIAPGELVDKLTILEIKIERMTDPIKLHNVRLEYTQLSAVCDAGVPPSDGLADLRVRLKEINARLWTIEDDIRDLERRKDFGAGFVALARSVYRTNDERALVKRQINEHLNSPIVEEKSYAAY
jgi:hypothetical protein